MLEIFFDDEKSFTVFEKILKSDDVEVDIGKIGWELELPIPTLYNIIHAFEFLDIIEIIDRTHVKLNLDSKVLLALCIFDEAVGNYAFQKSIACSREMDMEDGDFQEFLEFLRTFSGE